MTIYKTIDGKLFKKMIINGALNLNKNSQAINDLNVFPVRDGDTGNNMKMTMLEGIKKLENIDDSSIIKVTQVLSDALLINSKGNSGVILSQFFCGIYEQIKIFQKNNINISDFIQSLARGYQKAYNAVIEPVEGTILTVFRESIESVRKEKDKWQSINEVVENLIKYAEISLKKTPDLLSVLKKANVVDSGGAGYILILNGMLSFLNDTEIQEYTDNNINNFFLNPQAKEYHYDLEISKLNYIYCTEFIIKLQSPDFFDVKLQKKYFMKQGDSLIFLKNNDLLKIHIHTNDPGIVLTSLLKYGTLIKCKIDDMKEQIDSVIEKKKKNNDFNINTQSKDYAVIAISFNKELQDIFKDLKVDYIIEYIPDNDYFLIQQLRKILTNINVKNILIFPNYKKTSILLQNMNLVKDFTSLNIEFLQIENIAQCYSALLFLDEKLSLKENLKRIEENMKKIKIGEIIFNNNISIQSSQNISLKKENKKSFLAIWKQKQIAYHQDLVKLVKKLLVKMIKSKNIFLTFFYNKNLVKNKDLLEIDSFLEQKYSFIEIEKIENNDDSLSPCIFLLE
ncbi:DAK2 domain-containing protein [Candidatus Phytoplasma pini]|uniref:DhaL domain-containing protein n=1 Tax=Candidatus Phytoplasma pini TaxID=267362 RepID=A0A559KJJ7_9MOLU|nr:DAK2 domain-containing protein [Candidatus Phytoplasma pini]TVY12289.1 hypothetical protein MDPP_00169 [Candidatus Phytoplasma pini]